jgi:outer membrane protein assembly factor BamA
MKLVILSSSFILAALWLGPMSALAASVTLKDIQAKDAERLKKELPALFSGSAGQTEMDEAIHVLMTGTGYENIFVYRTAPGHFEITGKPLRTVEEIRFTGRSEASESDLNELLQLTVGERFDR